MTTGRLVKSLAALSVTGVAVLGFQAPAAVAQPGPPPDRPCGQGNGNPPQYPPGQQKKNAAIDDSTPNRGQQVRATTPAGAFDRNSRVRPCMHSTPRDLGIVVASEAGAAGVTFTVPANTEAGLHYVSFNGYLQGQPTELNVPFTVAAATAPGNSGAAPGKTGAAPGRNRNAAAGRLPRTGADHIVELTAAGLGLVALGGSVLVVSRRRREQSAGLSA